MQPHSYPAAYIRKGNKEFYQTGPWNSLWSYVEAIKAPVQARLKLVQQPCIKEKVKDGVMENIFEPLRDNSRTQVVVYETQAVSLHQAAVGGGEGGEGGINGKAFFEEKISEGNKLNILLKFNSNSKFVEFGKLHDNRKSRWLGRGLIVDVNEFGKRRVSWDRVKRGKLAGNWVERKSNNVQNKIVGLGPCNHKAQLTLSKTVGHLGSIESNLGLALTLSQPKPIQALLKHLDSKRASPSVQEAAAKAVLKRLLPECYVPSFQFKIVPRDVCGGQCCFLISNYNSSSKNGPEIMIKGTTAVEIASGLYWYLKYWCGAHVSWDKTGGVQIASIPKPGSMPLVKDDGVMIQRPVPWNYYQNVVTSSYSYVWWDWERWEKEIDWMALHGVNLPLAFVGQEAIWQKVFMDFNISKDDLNDFFGGPAFLAWARMGNLHGWGGPLTQNWLDQQLALQKRILSRMLELGMTPVLPSFSGNIPAALKKISPSANITKLGNWNSVDAKCRWSCTYLLDPSDPLFVEIGEAFIRRQVEDSSYDALEGQTKSLWKATRVPCLMGIRPRCSSCNNMF
nr:alpha-n-acetylglucosaminidase [Quercus suber]